MNNIWITLLLITVCLVGSYYLAQFWIPLGYLGFVGAIVIGGLYVFGRNRRIQ